MLKYSFTGKMTVFEIHNKLYWKVIYTCRTIIWNCYVPFATKWKYTDLKSLLQPWTKQCWIPVVCAQNLTQSTFMNEWGAQGALALTARVLAVDRFGMRENTCAQFYIPCWAHHAPTDCVTLFNSPIKLHGSQRKMNSCECENDSYSKEKSRLG